MRQKPNQQLPSGHHGFNTSHPVAGPETQRQGSQSRTSHIHGWKNINDVVSPGFLAALHPGDPWRSLVSVVSGQGTGRPGAAQ